MRINFYPILQYVPTSAGMAALGAAGPVGLGIAGAQAALGIVQTISGGARSKRLMKRRRAYQTPEEIFEILKAQQSRAAEGYDPSTLNYLTGNVDRSAASSIDAIQRLGGDPNQLSAMLDQAIQSKFRIGAENQLQNMKNFGGYIDALGLVASNDAAEQKSQQDLIKDELQAASMSQQSGLQNIIGGANTALSTLSSLETADLYKEQMAAAKAAGAAPAVPDYSKMFNFAPPTAPKQFSLSEGIKQMQSAGVNPENLTPDEISKFLDILYKTRGE